VSERYVAIRLKVPDNTAYTALIALRRLGVDVGRIERATIVPAGDVDDAVALERIQRDELLFNPNLHEVEIRSNLPQRGELLIREDPSTSLAFRAQARATAPIGARCSVMVSWKLLDERGQPVSKPTLERARDALLCNPAIEAAELLA
jgi:phosphoribosylformylglycinamidine (FGAM) synthase PurS component